MRKTCQECGGADFISTAGGRWILVNVQFYFRKWWTCAVLFWVSECLSACLCVCLHVCLCVCPSSCLSASRCLSVRVCCACVGVLCGCVASVCYCQFHCISLCLFVIHIFITSHYYSISTISVTFSIYLSIHIYRSIYAWQRANCYRGVISRDLVHPGDAENVF